MADISEIAEPDPFRLLEGIEPGGSIVSYAFVDGNDICFGSSDFHVYSLNKNNGKLNWKFRTRGMVGLSSPVVDKGVLYACSTDGFVYALEAKTGSLLWEFRTNDIIFTSPAAFEDKIFVTSMDGYLYCLDSGGTLKWKHYMGKPIIISPDVVNGNVFVGSWVERNYQCIAPDGKVLWKVNMEHWPTNGAFASPDGRFIADVRSRKGVECSDFVLTFGSWNNRLYLVNDEGKTIWKEDVGAKLSSPTIENGKIFATSFDSNVYSFSMKDATQMWRYATGDRILYDTPFVHKGILYTGSNDGNIYALNTADGSLIWRFQTAGPVLSPPVVSENILYVGSWDAHMYAFDISDPKNPKLLWKFMTGMPPSAPKFIKWIDEFEMFRQKYLNLQWKPETGAAMQEQGKKGGYEGKAVGIGDYSAFSRSAYAGFHAGEAYAGKAGVYTSKRDEKKRDAYK